METKITIIKSYRSKETLRLMDLQALADTISTSEYQEQVSEFRRVWPLMTYAASPLPSRAVSTPPPPKTISF